MTELVLRPTVRHRPWALLPVVFFVGLCAFIGGSTGITGLLGGLGVGSLVVVPIAGHLLRSRITVTPAEIAVRGFVTHKRADRHQAASIVRAQVVAPRAPTNDTIFVLDRDEQLLLRIHGLNHPRADLDRLVEQLRLPAETVDLPITAHGLATRYPGIAPPWIERHPVKFALALVGAVVLLPLVAAIVVVAMF